MSLISAVVLLASPALAGGTAVWLEGTPDPTATPGKTPVAVSLALPSMRWGADDDAAITALRESLEQSRPLLDVFDGELQILRDMGATLSALELVRPEDRDLVWRSLLLQGHAAHRYFGDSLATEAAAQPYRAQVGGQAAVGPWRDAIALDPDRLPTEAELPDEAARLAFQELRAQLLLEAPASIGRGSVDPAVRFVVDGAEVALEEAKVAPGTHYVHLEVDGAIRARMVVQLQAGDTGDLGLPASTEQLAALAPALADSEGGLPLSESVLVALAMVEGPVELVVPGRKSAQRFEVTNGAAVRVSEDLPAAATGVDEERGLTVQVGLAGAWVYDGDYLLQNVSSGAPSETGTVNAFAPQLGLAGLLPVGPLALGAGVDLTLPLGTWHELPSGEGVQRLRAHPHLQVGHPLARATVGFLTPWHLALGARASLPLTDSLGLDGGYTHGVGIALSRDAGQPDFEPAQARLGHLGVHWRFGG